MCPVDASSLELRFFEPNKKKIRNCLFAHLHHRHLQSQDMLSSFNTHMSGVNLIKFNFLQIIFMPAIEIII